MSIRSFDVSWRAIGKILIAAALVWAWMQLWQFVLVIAIALVMAVAIDPAVRALEKRGVPRWAGAFGFVLLVAALAVGAIAASWVSISEQAGLIAQNLRDFYHQVRASIPAIDRLVPSAEEGGSGIGQYAMTLGRSTAHAVAMFVIALVLTVYLLIEWRPTLEWLIAFVPPEHRQKVRRTLAESRTTVFQYVVGNVITSVITAVATFIALIALKVPAALAGVMGALLALPIAALYPTIERIWLRQQLSEATVEKHENLSA